MVELPLEPIYEETIVISSAQSKRERNARNAQQKMNWQNKCQRLIEISILCGDKAWPLADRKMASVLYLGIGVELAENCDFEKKEQNPNTRPSPSLGKMDSTIQNWHYSQRRISFSTLYSDQNLRWRTSRWNPYMKRQKLFLRHNLREKETPAILSKK